MPVSRLLIQGAVKCPNWQAFRKSLKGISTQQKLVDVLEYVQPIDWKQRSAVDTRTVDIVRWKDDGECDYMTRCIQTYNYVTALARGGQIAAIPDKFKFHDQIEEFLRGRKYVILK